MKFKTFLVCILFASVFSGCNKPADYLYFQPDPEPPAPPAAQKPAPAPGQATQSFYACGNGNLYTLSVAQGTVLSVIQTTYQGQVLNLNDMAIDNNGTIYGKESVSNGIYIINAQTGVATQILSSIPDSLSEMAGLTLMPNGNLATFDMVGNIISINLTTKQTSVFIRTNYSMSGGDLKLLPDGFIYWTVSNSTSNTCQNSVNGTQALVRIDPKTGATLELGCLNEANIFGLGFANGAIYGFSGSGDVLQVSMCKTHSPKL